MESFDTNAHLNHPPRPYKSRKSRPCDFCRARQVACKLDVPPCSLCASHSRECTFLDRPKKKRRPVTNGSNGEVTGEVAGMGGGPVSSTQPWDVSSAQMSPGFIVQYGQTFNGLGEMNGINAMNGNGYEVPSPNGLQQMSQSQHSSPIYDMDPYMMMAGGVRIRPLDSPSTRSARFIGETGESNPYLLRHYRYNENDECTISKLTYRRVKTHHNAMSGEKGEPPVVFMLADDSLAQKGEPRVEDPLLAKAQSELSSMFTDQESLRLCGLFFRFVYPYFPILSKSEYFMDGNLSPSILHILPMSLLSAIYATALPFMLYDDLLATTIVHSPPSANQLFRISWISVTQELHTPRLATLQACLLLLQRAPTNRFTTDTPWKTSLVGWTVSLAQTLGIMKECGDWTSIPTWEMTLRKRLWYGVFIMDKWASLGAGMPSHIRSDDFDVLPLSETDFEPLSFESNMNAIPSFLEPEAESHHFRLLSELTMILSDIMDSYYSLRATQRTSKDFTLSLDLARPLRSRLKAWNDSMPPSIGLRQHSPSGGGGISRLSGSPSLSLAYIVATMTLFRALLRPLENLTSVEEEDHGIVGSRTAVRAGAKECAKEVVEFVENLGRGTLDSFWHSWSRANFAIASSFLIQLLFTAETAAESSEINDLVARWRWAMRVGSGSTGNGLMSLGLLRLDGLLLENGTVQPSTR